MHSDVCRRLKPPILLRSFIIINISNWDFVVTCPMIALQDVNLLEKGNTLLYLFYIHHYACSTEETCIQ